MDKIDLTDEMASWLKENYGKMTQRECAKYFKISIATISRWIKILGLSPRKPKEIKKILEVDQSLNKPIGERGYCIDCKHYVVGGNRARTARYTGALNEKPCFKRNEQ